jgi:hypothetical protein
MALSILYSIVDAKDVVSTMEINIPTATTLANATTFAQAMAGLINAVTTGVIRRIGVVLSVALPGGLRTGALTNSDVEEGARFQFSTSGGNFTSFRIPTFNELMITSNSRAVDLEDTDVAALVTAMEDGIGGITPTDKRNEDVVALTSAREQFQSSRGGS